MGYFDDFIETIRHGAAHQFVFTVMRPDATGTLQPVNLNDYPAMMLIAKRFLSDPDSEAIFTLALGTGLTALDAPNGRLQVQVSGTHTAGLENRRMEIYAELRARDGSAEPWSLSTGRFPIEPAVRLTLP